MSQKMPLRLQQALEAIAKDIVLSMTDKIEDALQAAYDEGYSDAEAELSDD